MPAKLSLRQFDVIMAVATHGSFSVAAARLHVSQPALSRTVRLAEESLGARVFDRGSRGLTLTPAGAELLGIARRILLEFNGSMSELSQFIEGRRGRVRVSSLPSTIQPLLVDAIAGFRAEHADIEFLVRIDPADVILALIEDREIDLALTVQPPPDGRYAYQHLHDDEFVLICRGDDDVVRDAARGRSVPWQVLQRRPFIAAMPGTNTRAATDAAFMLLGLAVRPAIEVAGSLSAIGAMVVAGLGLSVLPRSALPRLEEPMLVTRRLGLPRMKRRIGLVTLSGHTLSAATRLFSEHFRRAQAASRAAPSAPP